MQALTLFAKWSGEMQEINTEVLNHTLTGEPILVEQELQTKHMPVGIYLARFNAILMLFFVGNAFIKFMANEMRIARNVMLQADLVLCVVGFMWASTIYYCWWDQCDEKANNYIVSYHIRNVGVALSLLRFLTIVDKDNTLETLLQTVLHWDF